MKLWGFLLVVLLCAFITVGYGDIGFGSDMDIEDEEGPEVMTFPSLVPAADMPTPVSVIHAGRDETIEMKEPDLVSAISTPPHLKSQSINTEGMPLVVDIPETEHDSRAAHAIVLDTQIEDLETTNSEKSTVDNTAVSEEDGRVGVDSGTVESHPPTITTKSLDIPATAVVADVVESFVDGVFANTTSMDSDFSVGGSTEVLLDQLDEADQEIAALTATNSALKASLAASTDEARALSSEVNILRGKLAGLYSALTTVQSEYQSRTNISAAQWDDHNKQHAEEIQSLADKLSAAERNATTLEIRARLEKNEKNIARLSTENCMLELEATRHLQQDELIELKTELAALKKAGDGKCSVNAAQPNSAAPITTRATTAGTTPSPAAPAIPRASSAGDCDASQCLDSLLSKYVFFWAAEHQADVTTTPKPKQPLPAPVTGTLTTSMPINKVGRTDADLDKVGDEDQGESTSAVMLHHLQHAVSVVWMGFANYVHPFVYRMLKYEFQFAAAVVKSTYEAGSWLWSSVISPVFFNTVVPTVQTLYTTQVVPLANSTMYPWYKTNLEDTVNAYVVKARTHWIEHYDDWFGYHVVDPFEFVVGRLYVAQYFALKFFSSEDLGEQLERLGDYAAGFVPSVIHQLSSIGALQNYFGEHCVTVVSVLVYGSVALFLYLTRRVLLGVVAFFAVMLLSPLLFVVYVFAKIAAIFRPRKKSKRPTTGRPSRSVHNGQHQSQQPSQQGLPPQLATKQLPINMPLASVAPLGRELSRSSGVNATGRPPQSSGSGGSAPLAAGKYSSGLPPRQIYNRMDLGHAGSSSNSGESLSKLSGPPLNASAGTEPEV